jgi:hypothetical protein
MEYEKFKNLLNEILSNYEMGFITKNEMLCQINDLSEYAIKKLAENEKEN